MWLWLVTRLRAKAFGRYRSFSAAAKTRSRVSALTGPLPLSAMEAVDIDTPASLATSLIVADTDRTPPYSLSSL